MMDSRTFLDRPGANRLIGKGDMLSFAGSRSGACAVCLYRYTGSGRDYEVYCRQQSYPTPFFLPEYVSEDSGSEVGDIDMGRSRSVV